MPYSTIDALLKQNNPDLSAAEAHGVASGILCVNGQASSEYWLGELLDHNQPLNKEGRLLLTRLFEETRRLLASDAFDFALLLPDDDELLSIRVTALKAWCQGFLFGTGCGQLRNTLSADAQGILKDIAEFTKLETDAEGEEDEAAFVEISEYLRSAVLLLQEELDADGSTTIH